MSSPEVCGPGRGLAREESDKTRSHRRFIFSGEAGLTSIQGSLRENTASWQAFAVAAKKRQYLAIMLGLDSESGMGPLIAGCIRGAPIR